MSEQDVRIHKAVEFLISQKQPTTGFAKGVRLGKEISDEHWREQVLLFKKRITENKFFEDTHDMDSFETLGFILKLIDEIFNTSVGKTKVPISTRCVSSGLCKSRQKNIKKVKKDEISQCYHCHCMTKTIYKKDKNGLVETNCGKCGGDKI
jgi:hypothetical protein